MALGEKSQIPKTKSQLVLVDLFGGEKDLKDKIVRAVGNPEERFSEDDWKGWWYRYRD